MEDDWVDGILPCRFTVLLHTLFDKLTMSLPSPYILLTSLSLSLYIVFSRFFDVIVCKDRLQYCLDLSHYLFFIQCPITDYSS